ncbi:hypothetical protein BSK62_22715 [Paenibacillus odorifer]|uniref:hypothetical protein n=1 Tax=Paenibacillus TaxID=44249 RepID=UPI00096DA120|nr:MULTISPECIES: hypothetical protein [Paenibacillus]MDH6430638.1 hypothetical protein [Paenibacillus sp. PastH-4]MDH6443615.1 hypothetical protein [Paenibacillus sp. PastF-4]MDH6527524.1 hypothetical protein [Paenibacillus sp. PastH-3]OMD58057.1 hypothetical protein BSK55_15325 [Paenibacillus odorifer]OMD62201.1 hypothetical protein BSK62_22715 [Paenibacillus odorifer]
MKITSAEEIMILLSSMDKEHSAARIYVPGIGEFTIVLQKKEGSSRTAAEERIIPAAGLTRNPYL